MDLSSGVTSQIQSKLSTQLMRLQKLQLSSRSSSSLCEKYPHQIRLTTFYPLHCCVQSWSICSCVNSKAIACMVVLFPIAIQLMIS